MAGIFAVAFLGRATLVFNGASAEPPLEEAGVKEALSVANEERCMSPSIAADIKNRLQEVSRREAAAAKTAKELADLKDRVDARLAELETANAAYKANLDAAAAKRDADIAKLAAIYTGMKPAQASAIISKMDPQFSAGLLASIADEQAAAIVAAMPPEKAYLISVLLANGR